MHHEAAAKKAYNYNDTKTIVASVNDEFICEEELPTENVNKKVPKPIILTEIQNTINFLITIV